MSDNPSPLLLVQAGGRRGPDSVMERSSAQGICKQTSDRNELSAEEYRRVCPVLWDYAAGGRGQR